MDEKGSFETALPLSLSLPMRGDARLGSRLGFSNGVVEVIEVGADDRLTVALKGDEIITVLVSVGGDRSSEELGVECWVQRRGVKAVLQSPWGAERPKLSPEGMTTIPTTRDQVVIGSIWKFVYGLGTPSVLGFFEIDPMKSSTVQVKLAGRLVRVEHAQPAEQDTTQITVIWRSPGGMTLRCPVRWLAGQDAPAFWCPNTDVDIEFERDGAVQEFLGFSGARIALAGW